MTCRTLHFDLILLYLSTSKYCKRKRRRKESIYLCRGVSGAAVAVGNVELASADFVPQNGLAKGGQI